MVPRVMFQCLIKHHAMKMNGGSGGIVPLVLSFSSSWRQVVSFTPRPLLPRGWRPCYWFVPRASLDAVAKRKISTPARNRTPSAQYVQRMTFPGSHNNNKNSSSVNVYWAISRRRKNCQVSVGWNTKICAECGTPA
jgi:hypothetical protein